MIGTSKLARIATVIMELLEIKDFSFSEVRLKAKRALGILFLLFAFAMILVQLLHVDILLSWASDFTSTRKFNVNIHDIATTILLTIPPDIYEYYKMKGSGEAEVSIINPQTNTGVFSFPNPTVDQQFEAKVILRVDQSLMSCRGWQMQITYDITHLSLMAIKYETSIFQGQAIFQIPYIDSTTGEAVPLELAIEHSCTVLPNTYMLMTLTYRLTSTVPAQTEIAFRVIDEKGRWQSMFIGEPEGTEHENYTAPIMNVQWQDATVNISSPPPSGNYGANLDSEAATYCLWITPRVFTGFASELSKFYSDDEDYVNAVLQIIEQMTYEPSGPHYPIVLIGRGWGDCDSWSVVAASLLKARNIDCVLLKYSWGSIGHMNLGVKLSHPPRDYVRSAAFGFNINGQQYWMAECTGQSSQLGWRVGEIPDSDLQTYLGYILLDQVDETAPPNPISYQITEGSDVQIYTLTISATTGGTTNPAPSTYIFYAPQTISVQAMPSPGYVLAYWKLDGANVGNATVYDVSISKAASILEAFFKRTDVIPETHKLTVRVTYNGNPAEGAVVRLIINGVEQKKTVDASGICIWDVDSSVTAADVIVTYNGQTNQYLDVQLSADKTINSMFYGTNPTTPIWWWILAVILIIIGLVLAV